MGDGKRVLTRIWGRLGTGLRHSHEREETLESVGEADLEVKVFV